MRNIQLPRSIANADLKEFRAPSAVANPSSELPGRAVVDVYYRKSEIDRLLEEQGLPPSDDQEKIAVALPPSYSEPFDFVRANYGAYDPYAGDGVGTATYKGTTADGWEHQELRFVFFSAQTKAINQHGFAACLELRLEDGSHVRAWLTDGGHLKAPGA